MPEQCSPSPHLPMAMHSCRIWPKGRRRLNWSCPSKERESYQGSGPEEERQREVRGGRQQVFPCPGIWQKRQPPTIRFHPASASPAPHHLALPGPLTLVSVGEIPSARTVNQTLGGSRTVLCRISGEDKPQGRGCWTHPQGALRRLAANLSFWTWQLQKTGL